MWDERYAENDGYLYGTEPNDFVREQLTAADGRRAVAETPGRALAVADGEGRNGVFLASLGWEVTTFDGAQSGVDKARRLAAERGVTVDARCADAADIALGSEAFDLVVSVFAHMPPPVRADLHRRVVAALRPGGVLVLEAYTPDQIGKGTGGPPVPELTMTRDLLAVELDGLVFDHAAELDREVHEGPGHTGLGSVVQIVARKPA